MIINSKGKHYGYIKNDDTASGGKVTEHDILTCAHCQKLILKSQWETKGGWCWKCGKHVCFGCAEKTKVEGCLPWRKRIDTYLEEKARQRQLSRALGLEG